MVGGKGKLVVLLLLHDHDSSFLFGSHAPIGGQRTYIAVMDGSAAHGCGPLPI